MFYSVMYLKSLNTPFRQKHMLVLQMPKLHIIFSGIGDQSLKLLFVTDKMCAIPHCSHNNCYSIFLLKSSHFGKHLQRISLVQISVVKNCFIFVRIFLHLLFWSLCIRKINNSSKSDLRLHLNFLGHMACDIHFPYRKVKPIIYFINTFLINFQNTTFLSRCFFSNYLHCYPHVLSSCPLNFHTNDNKMLN